MEIPRVIRAMRTTRTTRAIVVATAKTSTFLRESRKQATVERVAPLTLTKNPREDTKTSTARMRMRRVRMRKTTTKVSVAARPS